MTADMPDPNEATWAIVFVIELAGLIWFLLFGLASLLVEPKRYDVPQPIRRSRRRRHGR